MKLTQGGKKKSKSATIVVKSLKLKEEANFTRVFYYFSIIHEDIHVFLQIILQVIKS